jgi:predicted dehydrogenase
MLRWLVVGVGDIAARRVLPSILEEPRSSLSGLVTRDAAKAQRYRVPSWNDLDTALAQAPADAVYIATPVFLHERQTVAALRAGKHVLCEKPMAMNYGEASAMLHASIETGRTLGISYYRRLYPKVLRARELLAAGAIGRPVLAEATSHGWFAPDGGARDWLYDPARAGGGPLYDIASHRIDLMNCLFGSPMRACGHSSTLVQPIAVEDNATVLIEYDSGVRGVVDVRWHSRIARDEFRIRGTDGEMELSPLNGPSLVWPGGELQLPAHANLHYPCIHNFVNAVLEGAPLASSAATALPTEWVIAQAAS